MKPNPRSLTSRLIVPPAMRVSLGRVPKRGPNQDSFRRAAHARAASNLGWPVKVTQSRLDPIRACTNLSRIQQAAEAQELRDRATHASTVRRWRPDVVVQGATVMSIVEQRPAMV